VNILSEYCADSIINASDDSSKYGEPKPAFMAPHVDVIHDTTVQKLNVA
jgi:hypothetical protein